MQPIALRRFKFRFILAALAVAAPWFMSAVPAQAISDAVTITRQEPGPTPFISLVHLTMNNPAALEYVKFTVTPKEGSVTRPVSARYPIAYLQGRNYVNPETREVTVPVFGLYQKFNNSVTLVCGFVNGTTEQHTLSIQTQPFKSSTYKRPTVVQSRDPNSALSYDFILLKNFSDAFMPVILDTDGEMRWVGTANNPGNIASTFYKNGVYVTDGQNLLRIELDGQLSAVNNYLDAGVLNFHHNMDFGRDGIILDADTSTAVECVNIEVDANGKLLRTWNLQEIVRAAMIEGGDNPDEFIQPYPGDWFHNNSVTYCSSDNTLLVSSRENFVIALDYDTGAIRWILGDASKHWYQFPSLRRFALNLTPGSEPPIGQHALSMVGNRLLLFDNGFYSQAQAPAGIIRRYSAARKYRIDIANRTATETWNFLADKSIYSPVCSSIYMDQPQNYLINYATGGATLVNKTLSQDAIGFTKLVGLDETGKKAFDYQYEARDACGTGWNAMPIHWEDLSF
jgi:arylsulfate sulfotransferase